MSPLEQLDRLGLKLPTMPAPVGVYIHAVRVGNSIYTSGQLPFRDGKLMALGKISGEVSLEAGRDAARQAALNALAAASSVCGGLDRIERIVRVCVYVNSSPGFTDQPKVANGASELLGELFGDKGRHARSAVGVSELPLNAPVELELLVVTP